MFLCTRSRRVIKDSRHHVVPEITDLRLVEYFPSVGCGVVFLQTGLHFRGRGLIYIQLSWLVIEFLLRVDVAKIRAVQAPLDARTVMEVDVDTL